MGIAKENPDAGYDLPLYLSLQLEKAFAYSKQNASWQKSLQLFTDMVCSLESNRGKLAVNNAMQEALSQLRFHDYLEALQCSDPWWTSLPLISSYLCELVFPELEKKESLHQLLDCFENLTHEVCRQYKPAPIESIDFHSEVGLEYTKNVFLLFPTHLGLVHTACICFPEYQTSIPHTHPELVVEKVLEGTLYEIHFHQNEKAFEYTGTTELKEGSFISSCSDLGYPHSVRGKNGPVRTIATFAGFEGMRKISSKEILNLSKIPKPFPY